jgi:hypothetical protein
MLVATPNSPKSVIYFNMEYRKYEVWHDESKVGGYHHGILFVPIDKKE